EIRRRVCDAQLRQRTVLTSALSARTASQPTTAPLQQQQTLYDSSTVTEASSEETTPHVSRESSRANDFRNVAAAMFERQQPPATAHVPIYGNARPQAFHSKFAGTDSMLKYSKTPIQEPPSAKMPLSATLLLNARNNIRPSVLDFKPKENFSAAASSSPSSSINKRWRRKTLGGDDYSNLQSQLLAKCNNRPSLEYSNQKSVDLQQEFRPLTNIVKERLTFFANNSAYSNPCSPSYHSPLEKTGRSMTSSVILQKPQKSTPQKVFYTSKQFAHNMTTTARRAGGRSTSCQRNAMGEVSYV
uniref:Uncharacterized protein n=1 Tax=Romanomermis culicivorax TaxID=13658 RepID=A0A915IEW7_ROMCU